MLKLRFEWYISNALALNAGCNMHVLKLFECYFYPIDTLLELLCFKSYFILKLINRYRVSTQQIFTLQHIPRHAIF